MVTSIGKQTVTYPDGSTAQAYTGVHLSDVRGPVLSPWSSRSCLVLPVSIWTVFAVSRKGSPLSTPYIDFKPYLIEGWPAKLQYQNPSNMRQIREWFYQNNAALKASLDEALERLMEDDDEPESDS